MSGTRPKSGTEIPLRNGGGLRLCATLLLLAGSLLDARENYRVESIPTPPTVHQTQQIDALCFTPDGKLAVCLPSGEIWLMDNHSRIWSLFAEGLHNPLGILAVSEHEFIVTQRPELTRVMDEDGDGKADHYECLSDQFGLSGNYHEFNFTPVADAGGDIYFALGTGSSGDGIRQIVRGQYNQNGRPGRMHASVPYRGWIMKHDQNTGETIPWASGLRTPNGLGFDLKGNLFATDNQGDWVGACKLFHIQQGEFYGHAASFNWRPDAGEPALNMGAEKLNSYRTRAAVVFPYGTMSNSPSQPLVDDRNGGFGPFQGQLFVGEMNQSRIIRIMLEEVDGQLQGACVPFLEGIELPKGANRLAFAPDNSLYVGHTKHTWPGEKGISRIIWDGKPPMDVLSMNLTRNGFKLTFTKPLDVESASNKDAYQFHRYFYDYHEAYGSKQYDRQKVAVKSVQVSDDHRTVEIELEELACYYIHDLQLNGLSAEDGSPLAYSNVAYTVNRLIENTPSEPRQYDYEKITAQAAPEKEGKTVADRDVLKPYDGPSVRGADSSTLKGKVMTGYQGWFNCEGDGADLGWTHWTKNRKKPFAPGNVTVDLWPDISEYDDDELYVTEFQHADGTPARVFSSHNRKTVIRHFKWMSDYGIDGAFVQRFANGLKDPVMRYHKNKVLSSAREGANRYGRTYTIMYDLTGMPDESIGKVFDDWRMLREKMQITKDPAFQHHQGKPLVAIWGVGFNNKIKRRPDLKACEDLIKEFKADGCSIMLGTPTGWRTQDKDALPGPDLHRVLLTADILSPWTVGRYRTPEGAEKHAEKYWSKDITWTRKHDLGYMPVIFPGFSWHNLKGAELGSIPRLKGEFMWSQVVANKQAGADMIYVAMFDEVDEATAIFKCTNDPPTSGDSKFLTLEGLPSDFYLRLAGEAGKLLRDEISLSDSLPVELKARSEPNK